jgi:hypothetical protein
LQHFETNSRTAPFFRHSYIETNDSGREWHGKAMIWPERANGPRCSYLAGNSTRAAPSQCLRRSQAGGRPGSAVYRRLLNKRSLRPGTSSNPIASMTCSNKEDPFRWPIPPPYFRFVPPLRPASHHNGYFDTAAMYTPKGCMETCCKVCSPFNALSVVTRAVPFADG